MTLIVFYAAKGGVGTSVVAAATALLAAERQPTLLVDLTGDHAMIFGSSRPDATLSDWFRVEAPHPDSLTRLECEVSADLALVAVSRPGCLPRPERLRTLAKMLAAERRTVVIDLGRLAQVGVSLVQAADRSYLVTRPCYLALRAAMAGLTPDGIVLVSEKGRSLGRADVSAALGAPVVTELCTDPAVARAIDSGLLASRLPRSLRPLERLL